MPSRVVGLFNRVEGHIFVLDEDFVFADLEYFWEDIKESKNYYIFISREGFEKIPYGVDTTFVLDKKVNTFTMKRKYDDEIFSSNVNVRTLICEDSGIGYNLLCNKNEKTKMYGDIVSSYGRNNLVALATEQ